MEKIWHIEFDDSARKALRKLDQQTQKKILSYLDTKIKNASDPTEFGKPLIGNLSGLWRYRVGDYRIICRIIKNEITILVLDVGHRKNIY